MHLCLLDGEPWPRSRPCASGEIVFVHPHTMLLTTKTKNLEPPVLLRKISLDQRTKSVYISSCWFINRLVNRPHDWRSQLICPVQVHLFRSDLFFFSSLLIAFRSYLQCNKCAIFLERNFDKWRSWTGETTGGKRNGILSLNRLATQCLDFDRRQVKYPALWAIGGGWVRVAGNK